MEALETRPRTRPVARAFLLSAFCTALSIPTLLLPATTAAQDYVGHEAASRGTVPTPPPKPTSVKKQPPEPVLRPLSELSASELAMLEAMLTAEVQSVVNRQTRIPGQGRIITVRVRYNRDTDEVDIDLGRAYIPRGALAVTEDLSEGLREVTDTVYDLLDGIFSFKFTNEQFDGKALSDFFEEFKKPEEGNKNYRRGSSFSDPSPVILSPGHGWYFHYGNVNDWKLQRPTESNGIFEDFLTPVYAIELGTQLASRSHDHISFISSTRSLYDTSIAPDSGKPWNQMAARYYIKDLLPERPEIWNAYPNGSTPNRLALREYDDDIVARPRFADYLSAGALLSLHTNASTNPNASGTLVYVSKASGPSVDLGSQLLCSMKEIIRAQPGYENWKVEDRVRPGSYGENAAAAPAAIIEIGFHTNPEDAAALKDPVFRQASMKGVEKGYRMFRQGNPCQHFQIADIPDITGPQNTSVPVSIDYQGFPQFPVRATVEFLTCASGWVCATFTRAFNDNQPSPLSYDHRCNTGGNSLPTSMFRIKSTLADTDGVKAIKEYNWTCTSS